MSNDIHSPPDFSVKKARTYLGRALRLRCPLCGISPVFPPLHRTRSFYDWFQPLDGCPRCGYAYEREPGYFLLATWGGIYGFGALLGMILYFTITAMTEWETLQKILFIAAATTAFCFLITRHVKTCFIAFDRFWDQTRDNPRG